MAKFRTHYDNLHVNQNAPLTVIKSAYKTLCQSYHPDKNIGDQQAHQIMQMINAAYAVLSNPSKRYQHDQWIAEKTNGFKPITNPKKAPIAKESNQDKYLHRATNCSHGLHANHAESLYLSKMPLKNNAHHWIA